MDNREKTFAILFERFEKEYLAGNAARLLDVISLCLQFNQAVPQWAINHFAWGAARYERAEAWRLEDAFDIHRPKGEKKAHARERYRRGLVAFVKAHYLVEREGYVVRRSHAPTHSPRSKKNKSAAAELAKNLPMEQASVERWYYDEQLMKELGYRKNVRRKSKKTEGD